MAYVGRYNYDELRKAAIEDPTPENLANLGEWFQDYGSSFWNGEYFDADGYRLYPVYSDPDDSGNSDLLGYDLR